MKANRIFTAVWAALVALAVPTKQDPALVCAGQVDRLFEMETHMPETKRVMLDPSLIENWPQVNPREDYNPEAMGQLGVSMAKVGLIEPIKVNLKTTPVGEGAAPIEIYQLIDGMGRLDQALFLEWDKVPVELYYDITLATALDIVSSALLRRPFNIVEQCRHAARLYAAGRNREYIAETMNLKEATVERRLLIDGLCDEVKDLMIRKKNPLPIHQALILVPLADEDAEAMAQDIAPEKGKVMTEVAARDWVKRQMGAPCPPHLPGTPLGEKLAGDDDEVEPPQEGSGSQDAAESTPLAPDPDPSPPAPIKAPNPGTAKDPKLVGLRRELPGVMRVEGVFNISKAGVRIDQATVTCEAGVCELSWPMDSLHLDLGAADIKLFQEFVATEAAEMPGEENQEALVELFAPGVVVNEHGVVTNPETIVIPLAKNRKAHIEIRLAETAEGRWMYAYDAQKNIGDHRSRSWAISATAIDSALSTKTEAMLDAIDDIIKFFDQFDTVGYEKIRPKLVKDLMGFRATEAAKDDDCLETIDLSVGDKVSLATFNVGISCQDQAKDPCVVTKVALPKSSGLPVTYTVADVRKYTFSCYRHQMEPWARAQERS